MSCQVAAILNLTPDHLERHKTMEAYGTTKCRIFSRMEASDVAIIPQCESHRLSLFSSVFDIGT